MTITRALLAASAALIAAAPAGATVTYSLVGFSDVVGAAQSLTVTLDDFLNADTNVDASQYTACASGDGATCTGFEFRVDDPFNNFADKSLLNFQTDSSGTFYYFDKDAFTHAGVFSNADVGFNLATLTVVDNGAGAVPEPATWGMMVLGFGLAGAGLRRRAGRTPAAA